MDGYNLDADFKGCTELVLNISFLMRVFFRKFEKVLTKLKISMSVFLVRSVLILQFVEISMVLTIVNVLKVSLVHSNWSLLGILI